MRHLYSPPLLFLLACWATVVPTANSAAPVNDAFANRIVLEGMEASSPGTIDGATREPDEPLHAGSTLNATVWWSWTAPITGTATVTTIRNSTFGHVICAYTGGELQSLVRVGGTTSAQGPLYCHVDAGVTYQFVVAAEYASPEDFVLNLEVSEGPTNDQFDSATEIIGIMAVVVGSNVNASSEPDEAAHGGTLWPRRTVWWSWTAPANGTTTISPEGSSFLAELSIYTGESVGSLQRVASVAGENAQSFGAVAGTTYRIAADGSFGQAGSIRLTLVLAGVESNDAFADATPVTGDQLTLTGLTLGATAEGGEPAHRGVSAERSIWWAWTAPANGMVRLSAEAVNSVPRVAVYRGSSVAGLTPAYAGPDWEPGALEFHAEAGLVYFIVVDGPTPGGVVQIGLTLLASPPNDQFARRTVLTGSSAYVAGNNDNCTREPGEPAHWSSESNSVWWTWTAPGTGEVTIGLLGEQFLPMLAVYSGASLNALSLVARHEGYGSPCEVAFLANQGTAYQLAIGTVRQDTGDFVLRLAQTPPPRNDRFADATVLVGAPASAEGSTLGARVEPGEPWHSNFEQLATVWWTWTAVRDGRVIVDTKGSGFDTVLAIYAGTQLESLTPIAANNDRSFVDTTSQVGLSVKAGETYLMAVGSVQGVSGPVKVALRYVDVPPNDSFAGRIALPGLVTNAEGNNEGASAEEDEPQHSAYQPPLASIWWTWTAPVDGKYRVSTRGSESATVLAAFRGASLETLWNVGRSAQRHGEAELFLDADSGTTYQIAVDSEYGVGGPVRLSIEHLPPPVNDEFAARTSVQGFDVRVSGANLGATYETGEPNHGDWPYASVWWSWEAPADGPVVVETAGSDFDTVLVLYVGQSPGSLTRLDYNDDADDDVKFSRIRFQAVAGTRYEIAVDGARRTMGEVELHLWCERPSVSIVAGSGERPAGSGLELQADVSGTGPLTLQWEKNGVAIPGATGSTFAVPCLQTFHEGVYVLRVSNALGDTRSQMINVVAQPPAPSNARLMNLSTRALDQTGDNLLIPGFVITGSGTKRMLIRGIGPGLFDTFGLGGTLADPQMTLMKGNSPVASNDDWGTSTEKAEIVSTSATVGAFPLMDGSTDAVLLVDLPAGLYTVPTAGANNGTGIAMVELYDADPGAPTATLVNISNRGFVDIGDKVMIPGFVVSNEGPRTFLIRAVGPGLNSTFDLTGVLEDPVLTVFKGSDAIFTVDDWESHPGAASTASTSATVGAFALQSGSKDAAIVLTLQPGPYTAQATGKGGSTGIALVEVYLVP